MLENDPRGASEIGLPQMETHVHLGGEELGNNLEGTNGANRGRPKKRIRSANKIVEDETGWPSVPTTHQNEGGYTLHPGIQAHE
jgi:hypothetical protein